MTTRLLDVMRRARGGLYGTTHIRFGNNVSHSKRHTRRTWKPNVQRKTFESEILETEFKLPVVARELRTVKKRGGFDRYILSGDKTFVRSEVAQSLAHAMVSVLYVNGQPLPEPVVRRPKPPQWLTLQREEAEKAKALKEKQKAEAEAEKAKREQEARGAREARKAAYLERQAARAAKIATKEGEKTSDESSEKRKNKNTEASPPSSSSPPSTS